jgi:hypothetical protein
MPTSASGYVTIPSVLEDHRLMHEQVIRGGQDMMVGRGSIGPGT